MRPWNKSIQMTFSFQYIVFVVDFENPFGEFSKLTFHRKRYHFDLWTDDSVYHVNCINGIPDNNGPWIDIDSTLFC